MMKVRMMVLCCLPLAALSCSWFKGSPKISEESLNRPMVSLFDGKSLEHWVIMGKPEGWKTENGVIHSDGGKGGNWLRSKKLYENFLLRLEWRVSAGGNSGVFIRCAEDGNSFETGIECQISNEQPPRDPLHCTGSLYGFVAADPRPQETPDVWHTYEIVCKNTRIIVRVDGYKTVDIDQDQVPAIKQKPLKGYIGLQDSHTEEGKWVEFRNIKIREL